MMKLYYIILYLLLILQHDKSDEICSIDLSMYSSFNSTTLQNLNVLFFLKTFTFYLLYHKMKYQGTDSVCFLIPPIHECAKTQGSCPEAAISILVIRHLSPIQIQNVLTVHLWSQGVRFYRHLMLINGCLQSTASTIKR